MKALPQVDRETADTLRARQHSQESAGTSLATSATVDVIASEDAELISTTAMMDIGSQHSSQVSRDEDVYNDASSSSSSGAGFARGGHAIRLLSLAPFRSASSSGSSSSNQQRPPQGDSRQVESREQSEADAVAGIQKSMEGSSNGNQPTNVRMDGDNVDQRGNGAASAQPAAPSYGGLPSPDSNIGSVATPASSSKFVTAEGQQLQASDSPGRNVDSSGSGGMRGADLMAHADRPPTARRVIRLKGDQGTARQPHQQQPGRGPPSSAGGAQDGSPDATRKGRTARSGGSGRASEVPSRRRPMQSLFWVLKHRSRETAQLRGTGSFALVAEAAPDGSVPRVCGLQGDVRLKFACCQPSRSHAVSTCTVDGVQATIVMSAHKMAIARSRVLAEPQNALRSCRFSARGSSNTAAQHGPLRRWRCQQLGLRRRR